MKNKRYYRCWKCGKLVLTVGKKSGVPEMCSNPMPGRYSGICGGSYNEVTPIQSEKTLFKKIRQAFYLFVACFCVFFIIVYIILYFLNLKIT
jgi:hypothetical protein